ncbi:MAG: four helix bundle protein [Phycisphaeraceae bacterium]
MAESAYRQLDVWPRGMDLVLAVYEVANELPASERFGLTSQMQRAAVSVPANIAEGYGRDHRGDYLRHLSFARGSLMELETHLTIAVRLGYVDREQAAPVWQLAQRVGQMLTQLIRSLKTGSPASTETRAPIPETRQP